MANRRSPPRKPLSNPTPRYGSLARRKYQLRHSPRSRKQVLVKEPDLSHAYVATSPASRPVLVPLHLNLRRLPSRIMAIAHGRDTGVNMPNDAKTGMKRKRIASVNENTVPSRSARAMGRFKRQRSQNTSSDDDTNPERSEMDIDEEQNGSWMSDASEMEEQVLDDSEDYLIHQAGSRQLNRLRKDELLRLYELAGLSELNEDSLKSDIINAIISSRNDDGNDLPPSSPPGRTDGHSSGYSSDEGHDGGGEETDAHAGMRSPIRRRVTVQDFGRQVNRAGVARTFSLDFDVAPNHSGSMNKKSARISRDVKSPVHHSHVSASAKRRGTSSQSSPTNSSISTVLPSPPATRLRSRTISAESTALSASTSSLSTSQGKGNSVSTGPSKRSNRPKHVNFLEKGCHGYDEFGLIEEQGDKTPNPSPRRLRSKKVSGSLSQTSQDTRNDRDDILKRVTPTRRAKERVGSMKDESTASEDEEEDELVENEDEEEVDELDSSPSPVGTPEPRQKRLKEQRTPLKKRLRPRKVQTLTPPSDGDDEEDEGDVEDEAEDNATVVDLGEEVEDDESGDGEESDGADEVQNDLFIEPRVLRNGKVVGEDVVEEDEEDEDGDSSQLSEIEVDQEESDSVEDGQAEDEDEDETMEDEFDLSTATQRTLVRLRRDDLLRLCEARELDVEGTKPQLAQALLEWRDQQSDMTSAPSSSSTARPQSITKTNGRRRRTRSKSSSNSATPPVLLRSERYHDDEPITPPVSKGKKDEGDLELDLESLGLEDREIPPDKLTKLEKIGSGGFKDVFIGKFRGRKVAIAEFRDQLSAMDIKELKLLAEFAHPNIVRFLGVSIPENTKETPVMIISELCANGDLFDYVRNVQAPSLYKVLNMMLDIAHGLQYLHERKPSVIHRDCKSSNILITSKGTAKIADFGLAKVKQSTRSMVRSLVGTVNWQAPELWSAHPKYNHKVDVFSCACVYWEMLQWHASTKKFPWEGMNEHAIYEAVGQKRQRPSVSGLRKQWCPEIVDLIENMWAQDPNDRPGIAEVVEELHRIIKIYR